VDVACAKSDPAAMKKTAAVSQPLLNMLSSSPAGTEVLATTDLSRKSGPLQHRQLCGKTPANGAESRRWLRG